MRYQGTFFFNPLETFMFKYSNFLTDDTGYNFKVFKKIRLVAVTLFAYEDLFIFFLLFEHPTVLNHMFEVNYSSLTNTAL